MIKASTPHTPPTIDLFRIDTEHTRQMEKMERLLYQLLWGQLKSMGLIASNKISPTEFKTATGLSERYGRWLMESLRAVEDRSFTLNDRTPRDIDKTWPIWDREKKAWLKNPYLKPHAILVEATMRALPQILTGEVPATDIIFPNSSTELVEGIYKNNPVADYFNEMLAHTAHVYIKARLAKDPSAKIRIFEIGAGTGGTSSAILEKIKPYQDNVAQYCYTDLSRAFLLHAQKVYGPDHPFLDVEIFDVSRPVTGQNVRIGGYDLVIAANVLHATPDIRQTLRNAKALLKANGLILLNEISAKSIFAHLTFGLLEGWWLYEDADLRIPGCPGLSSETWQRVLETEGFDSVLFPARTAHELGQQIILAQSDGVVRLPRTFENVTQSERKGSASTSISSPGLPGQKPQRYIARLLSSVIKLPVHKIDPDLPMEKYGIDSIMVMQLTRELEKTFGSLSKTLFFEYQTIRELTAYFIKHHGKQMTKLLNPDKPEIAPEKGLKTVAPAAVQSSTQWRKRSRMASLPSEPDKQIRPSSDIAIIGLSGRYPKAANVEQFWKNLRDGIDCITEIPEERWDSALYFDQDKNKIGKIHSKWGGFIDGVDQFDPLFFNISPQEAEYMDPQARLFLQTAYETLEDAGYTRLSLSSCPGNGRSGNVGVFVGVMYEEYQLYGAQEQIQGRPVTLSGSPAAIANRVSYYCNFHGPSMAVDTQCSSSLTAIHLACQSIRQGGCEAAIAGGVNLSIHPNKYLALSLGKFVSSKGRCESFGQGGDGLVPGEGVGAVLLKPLSKAMADRDHIYGVIKSTSINHGGKTNGFSVPNPTAQAEVVGQAYELAGISPKAVSYLEAHGTGTTLGDPIEIAGLSRAFGQEGNKPQYCAIGSVKSNIGHCESAAGIAGVTKVLLQLKHKQIAPSLHSGTLNSNIDFEKTPFWVQQKLGPWNRPLVQNGSRQKAYPRIAGISSFGAGGANAHVVIEEHTASPAIGSSLGVNADRPAIVVLSAINKERLNARAKQIFSLVTAHRCTDVNLSDVAYTLQVGREPMETRLALVVLSAKELGEKIEGFINGQKDIEGLYYGQVNHADDSLSEYRDDKDFQQLVDKWIENHNSAKLADLWVKGITVDWNKLHRGTEPRRISLPTYPFARERYWIPGIKDQVGDRERHVAHLHPMLHQNMSDFYEQRFRSTFTGKEFFLADHKVEGHSVLPAVAHLEMVRAAVAFAAGESAQDVVFRMKELVWASPIVVRNDPVQIHTRLVPDGDERIHWHIYSQSESEAEDAQYQEILHSQGSVVLDSTDKQPAALDIEALKDACGKRTLSSDQCYSLFKSAGLVYGPAHRGLEKIYVGQGQVLAKLVLPEAAAETRASYGLHPTLMDAALQACIGLVGDTMAPKSPMGPAEAGGHPRGSKLALPYAVQEVRQLKALTPAMWASVRSADNNGHQSGDKVDQLDIDICDGSGNVSVSIRGLSLRKLESRVGSTAASLGRLMFHPEWTAQAVDLQTGAPEFGQHIVVLCGSDAGDAARIKTGLNTAGMHGAECYTLQSRDQNPALHYQHIAAQLFEHVQKIAQTAPGQPVLIQVVIFGGHEGQLLAGLDGLLKTAGLENPKLFGQLIEVAAGAPPQRLIEILKENIAGTLDQRIRYHQEKRYVARWREMTDGRVKTAVCWKEKGVYLITGGAGGIGLLVAEEIAGQTQQATLILTGRSVLTAEKQRRIRKISEENGAQIDYHRVDVTRKNAVDNLIRQITNAYGGLNGIVHGAGIISDNFITQKTLETFTDVLAPKVSGLVLLDRACKQLPLDFFILFSSLAGAFGNVGQADYACANGFLDAFAGYRNELVAAGKRHGKTVSINWPVWKDGAMQLDPGSQKILRKRTGMVPMETQAGLGAMYWALASDQCQVAVVHGEMARLRRDLLSVKSASVPVLGKQISGIEPDIMREKTEKYLIQSLSSTLKLPAHRIEAEVPMEKYGIDSIMVTQMTYELEQTFGPLSKTLFFEYRNIRELAGYFIENHGDRLARLLEFDVPAGPPQTPVNDASPVQARRPAKRLKRHRFLSDDRKAGRNSDPPLDIAIVGLSGRYPKANNIEQFWKNLRDGRDCITEIPKDRWDHAFYFDADRNKPGKTYGKWGGFIDGVDLFDSRFFNISPREAQILDPQERLFLQSVYETIEDAGYTKEALNQNGRYGQENNVGVYVGVMYDEYQLYGAQQQIGGNGIALSGSAASIANRVSYFFNFYGPSMAVDTMCSSSLTAIHLACQSIQNGGCDVAIAGGVNVSVHPNKYLLLSQGQFISSSGRCASFGKGGDGYIPGEGVGAVLLKPLSKALDDRDHVYGVIKATAINHGGRTHGYTVPNPKAQAGVIARALKQAGVSPRTISYVEAHGTGTSLGDPIEITGLARAFGLNGNAKPFCAIGSAKSNIGHCESAAGIAAVTKVLLQLKYRQIAPSLHSKTLNPNIDFSRTPFVVQQELGPWERPRVKINDEEKAYPRMAGVSSFGAGGANAHVVIAEHTAERPMRDAIQVSAERPAIILLSAKNEDRLKIQAQQMLSAIAEGRLTDGNLAAAAYTLQVGREAMEARLAMIAVSVDAIEKKLKAFIEGRDDMDGFYCGATQRLKKNTLADYASDEDMTQTINAWFLKKKYGKLAQLWVNGLGVDWEKLYNGNTPCRVSLPTYPFDHKRYWIPDVIAQQKSENSNPMVRHQHLTQQHRSIADERYLLSTDTFGTNEMTQHAAVADKPKDIRLSNDVVFQRTPGGRKVNEHVMPGTNSDPDAGESHTTLTTPGARPVSSESRQSDASKDETGRHKGSDQQFIAITEELRSTLAQELLIPKQDVGVDDPFLELGMDSISGVMWYKKINALYGLSISAPVLYEHPTLRELAGFIIRERKKKVFVQKTGEPTKKETSDNVKSDLPIENESRQAVSGGEAPAGEGVIVPQPAGNHINPPTEERDFHALHLNTSTRGNPVYWIASDISYVNQYKKLTAGLPVPCYALMPIQESGKGALFVNRCVAFLESKSAECYNLGGFSMGGTLAYETAYQLQTKGKNINSLVLIDSFRHAFSKKFREILLPNEEENRILMRVNSILLKNNKKRIVGPSIKYQTIEEFIHKISQYADEQGVDLPALDAEMELPQKAISINHIAKKPLLHHTYQPATYFRVKDGIVAKKNREYHFVHKLEKDLKHEEYKKWKKLIPNLEVIEVVSESHFTAIDEQQSRDTMQAHLRRLYGRPS